MALYEAGGLGAATSVAANQAMAVLWNPGARTLRLREIHLSNASAAASSTGLAIAALSARGTQTATLLGTAQDDQDPAPSGTVDFAWSVQPTVSGRYLRRLQGGVSTTSHASTMWIWWAGPGIPVPAGAGVGLVTDDMLNAIGRASEITMVWEE